MTVPRIGAIWSGGLLLLLIGLPSYSQTGSAAPRGTYLKTCHDFRFDGVKLTATCAPAAKSNEAPYKFYQRESMRGGHLE